MGEPSTTFKIRMVSAWRREHRTARYLFSQEIQSSQADALLCEWEPDDELLTFPGPKAWYNSEAVTRGLFREPKWDALKAGGDRRMFLYHAHPDPRYRVPMICFVDPILTLDTDVRLRRAVTIISNTGKTWSTPDIEMRNRFAMHHLVDIYGREDNWEAFMLASRKVSGVPPNYRGPIPGTWNNAAKYQTLARYKVAICLENVTEPYYCTEKFYAAAQSGCVPIYHAHATVRDGVLRGARWIDPAVFNFDIEATLAFALAQERDEYASDNFKWLKSEGARAAGLASIFDRLGEILAEQLR